MILSELNLLKGRELHTLALDWRRAALPLRLLVQRGGVQYSKTEVYASFIMLLSGEQ